MLGSLLFYLRAFCQAREHSINLKRAQFCRQHKDTPTLIQLVSLAKLLTNSYDSLRDLKHPGALRSSTGTSFGATTPSPPLPPILAQYQEQMAQMKATNVGGSGAAESNRERSESGASKTSSRQSQKAPAIDERRRVPIPARPSTSGAALPASMSNVRNRRANGIGRAQ